MSSATILLLIRRQFQLLLLRFYSYIPFFQEQFLWFCGLFGVLCCKVVKVSTVAGERRFWYYREVKMQKEVSKSINWELSVYIRLRAS
jgi:hypothetical protein